ncbi:MAG: hypothetical protein M3Z02_00040 [Actinomycetota bacterium]|nr:hypothetical protein [Actinomycetota bacterium]
MAGESTRGGPVVSTTTTCPAGSFVYVPPGLEHGFRVGRVQSRKLNIYLPAAMVGYFEELALANEAGTALAPEGLTAMAARHSMRVLGPVPDGYLQAHTAPGVGAAPDAV